MAKAVVCKTIIHQFDSGRRLHETTQGFTVRKYCKPFFIFTLPVPFCHHSFHSLKNGRLQECWTCVLKPHVFKHFIDRILIKNCLITFRFVNRKLTDIGINIRLGKLLALFQ